MRLWINRILFGISYGICAYLCQKYKCPSYLCFMLAVVYMVFMVIIFEAIKVVIKRKLKKRNKRKIKRYRNNARRDKR